MKCPGCGYVSFDRVEACKSCGAPLAATAAAPPPAPEIVPSAPRPAADSADGQLELRLEPERPGSARSDSGRGRRRPQQGGRNDDGEAFVEMLDDDAVELGGGAPFRIDEDLFQVRLRGEAAVRGVAAETGTWADQGISGPEAVADLPGPAFVFPDEDLCAAAGEPVIDREEEVPERYWAPEVAGFGRRAVALLADQAILAAILGAFFLGAFVALRLSGFDTGLFLSSAGLRASLAPFALLAALLSLVYHAFFHGSTGRTPGKALAGVEIRTGDGAVPTWARAILRWFCAALGLACAGVGIAWALFEPRRRGWADLLSGTVLVERRRADPAALTTPRGAGTMPPL